MAHFKRTTMGHPVIMGRKTWDSIGRALPGRRNIVVTRDANWQAAGAERAASIDEAVALCEGEPEAFVIGGSQIYADALPLADAIVATEIDRDVEGDVHFPAIDRNEWVEISRQPQANPTEALPFAFVHYARRDAAG